MLVVAAGPGAGASSSRASRRAGPRLPRGGGRLRRPAHVGGDRVRTASSPTSSARAVPTPATAARGSPSATRSGPAICSGSRRSCRPASRVASAVLRELRMVKDAEEIALLRRRPRRADRVVDAIAAGRLVGRTEADVAREVRGRLVAEGHDTAEFAIVGSGPELGVAPPRGVRAGHRGRRADRPRHRRTARRLRQRHDADDLGDRRRPGARAGRRVPRRVRRPASGPGGRDGCREAGAAAESIDAAARDVIAAAGSATCSSIGPVTGSASRGTKTRTSSPARAPPEGRHGVQHRTRHLPRR